MFEIVKEYYDSLWDNKTNNAMNVGSLVVIYDNDDTRRDEYVKVESLETPHQ